MEERLRTRGGGGGGGGRSMDLDLLIEDGFRADGRRADELREMKCSFSYLPDADGSVLFEIGNTKVQCAVFGPHEVDSDKQGRSRSDSAFLNLQYNVARFSQIADRRRVKSDRKALEAQLNIRTALESVVMLDLYPRSQFDVFIDVVQSDGDPLSAAMNASCLALASSGVQMRDVLCACSASLIDTECVVDSSYQELLAGSSQMLVALCPRDETIVFCQLHGQLHSDYQAKLYERARDGCQRVFAWMEPKIIAHVRQSAAT